MDRISAPGTHSCPFAGAIHTESFPNALSAALTPDAHAMRSFVLSRSVAADASARSSATTNSAISGAHVMRVLPRTAR